jgi:hypothetical protein
MNLLHCALVAAYLINNLTLEKDLQAGIPTQVEESNAALRNMLQEVEKR